MQTLQCLHAWLFQNSSDQMLWLKPNDLEGGLGSLDLGVGRELFDGLADDGDVEDLAGVSE